MKQERTFCFDVVRAAATVMVIAVHFFLNAGFYELPLTGPTMALSSWVRMLLMPCVPLFLMLSGYFCARRRWTRRHLYGLLSVLLTYFLSAALCLLFRGLWLKEELSARSVVLCLLDFDAAPYGWYVEMFLGLYLLMPFFNMGWMGLSRSGQTVLLAVLFLLVSLPALTNMSFQILPEWWLQLYPAAYYLLGLWLRDTHPRLEGLRGVWLLLIWGACAAAAAALRWVTAAGGAFTWAGYIDFNSPFVAGAALCAFTLLRRVSGQRLPAWVRRCVSRLAQLSLPIYLLSYIFDALFYPLLNGRLDTLRQRLPFLPLTVLAVLLCSALLSWPLDLAVKALIRRLPEGEEKTE